MVEPQATKELGLPLVVRMLRVEKVMHDFIALHNALSALGSLILPSHSLTRSVQAGRIVVLNLRQIESDTLRLTLAILEPLARAGLAVLLALPHARIARQQTGGFQGRTQRRVDVQ